MPIKLIIALMYCSWLALAAAWIAGAIDLFAMIFYGFWAWLAVVYSIAEDEKRRADEIKARLANGSNCRPAMGA